jgi:uroporphyrinogen decarboxylase
MNKRERFLKTINREIPDRPPLYVSLTPQAAKKLSIYMNLPYEEPLDSMLSTRASHMDLLATMGADAVGIAACAPDDSPTQTLHGGLIKNEWGMIFKPTDLYNEFYEFLLAHAETAWYLTGLEKFLMDMMMEAEYIDPLLDKIQSVHFEYGKKMIEMGIDVLWCGDDFGIQTGLMMDKLTFRKVFKQRIKELFAEFRKVNPDIKIAWHSCGSVRDLIPDFIEIGLDILNPLQPLAAGMDHEELKNEYGNDLIFFGGICVQDLLPNGTPESIMSEVKRIAEILGKNGGYIIAPAYNIQDDTPVENIIALFEAVQMLNSVTTG